MLSGILIAKSESRKSKMQRVACILLLTQTHLAKKKKVKRDRTKEFLQDELDEIKKHKWIESEKVGYDLGETCCLEWITAFAARYRKEWENKNGKIVEEIEIEDGINCSGC
jgi:hypothetical protein